MSGSIIVQSTYGYTPSEDNDEFIDISERSLGFYLDSHDPSWLVNVVPLGRSPSSPWHIVCLSSASSSIYPFLVPWSRLEAHGTRVEENWRNGKTYALRLGA